MKIKRNWLHHLFNLILALQELKSDLGILYGGLIDSRSAKSIEARCIIRLKWAQKLILKMRLGKRPFKRIRRAKRVFSKGEYFETFEEIIILFRELEDAVAKKLGVEE